MKFDQLVVGQFFRIDEKNKNDEAVSRRVNLGEYGSMKERNDPLTETAQKFYQPIFTTRRISSGLGPPMRTGRCFNCHANGLVLPFAHKLRENNPQTKAWKEEILSYGELDFEEFIDVDKLGPPMKFNRKTGSAPHGVRENCISCHDHGARKAPVNTFFEFNYLFNRVLGSEARMPYHEDENGRHHTPSPSYHDNLRRHLLSSYGQQFSDWIGLKACLPLLSENQN